jgi:PAS domain S-box-containing protein
MLVRQLEQKDESEVLRKYLLDTMADTYYELDGQGGLEVVSESCVDVTGYPSDELIGSNVKNFHVASESRNEWVNAMLDNGDQVARYRSELVHRSGLTMTLENTSRIRRNSKGEMIGTQGIISDITGRIQSEAHIEELARIVESSVNEIYVFDAESMNFRIVNKAARDNLGWHMDELRDMTPADLRPTHSGIDLQGILLTLSKNEGMTIVKETCTRRKDQSEYFVEMSFRYSALGRDPVFIAIGLDITGRKLAEAQLSQAQRLQSVGLLTGGVAHDINNMLQVIHLNVEKIVTDDSQQEKWRDDALRAVGQAARLTQRLKTFSHMQHLTAKVIDVNQSLRELEFLFRLTLTKSTNLELALGDESLLIEVDESRYESALLNLVLNAHSAMPEGGVIFIASQSTYVSASRGLQLDDLPPGDYVEIRLSDNGRGMDEYVLNQAIEPFVGTKKTGEGTGLGLSTVYGFLKQSGGYMIVESEINVGTTITLWFPISNNSLIADSEEPSNATPVNKETILLIEDDDVVRMLVARMLEDMGYHVIVAADSVQAESLARDFVDKIDVVISDVILAGGIYGPELVASLAATHGKLKTIFISGHARQYWSKDRRLPDDCEFLQKPFSQAQLDAAIRHVLGDVKSVLASSSSSSSLQEQEQAPEGGPN